MPQVEQKPLLCIVASQRAGTTALTRTLGRSPYFFNFGEIFRIENSQSKSQPGDFFDWARNKSLTLDQLQTADNVNSVAREYMNYLSGLAKEACPLIDIKFNAWQVLRPAWSWPNEEPFLLDWLKRDGAAFIMIRRRDLTQQLLSEVIAWNSGVWHGATEDQLPEKVVAPLDVVRSKAQRIIMTEKLFHDRLKDHPRVCFLTYEELYDGGRLASGASDFLNHVYGIDPATLPEVPVSKNAGDKRSLVKNYDQVEAEVNRVSREMGRELTD